MIALAATFVTFLLIAILFFLDRDTSARTSKALWIPTIWMLIIASRSISEWLHPGDDLSLSSQYSDSSPIDAAVYGLLMLGGLLTLNLRAQKVKRFLRTNMPLMAFFAFCALSAFWSDHSLLALKRWFKAVGDLVMILVVLTDLNPIVATRRLFTRTAFVLMPLSVLLILFYPNLGTQYDASEHLLMYTGVTTFKNLLGVTCMICGLGSLWAFLGALADKTLKHRERHLFAYGFALLCAFGLILRANSVTSLSCIALVGFIMVVSSRRWVVKHPRYLHGVIFFCIGFAFSTLFIGTMGSIVHSLGRNTTLTGRTSIWAAVLSIHINPLLGAGFESFWLGDRMQEVWDRSMPGIQEAHNGYLELYLNLGWAGLVLLGALIVSGYRHAYAIFRIDPQAGRIRLAFFAAALIYSFTEAGFRMMSPSWMAFLIAITDVPLLLLQQQEEPAAKITLSPLTTGRQARVLQ